MNRLVKTNSSLQKADGSVKVANKLLAGINISFLLFDEDRIKLAIELAINARISLDPYFQQSELLSVDREQLLNSILRELKTLTDSIISHNISIPKNKQFDRTSIYIDLQSYSIRYLICLIVSQKIPISDCVFGGKKEIFKLNDAEPYEVEINKFWKIQNDLLLSNSFSWIVYVDITSFYDSIENDILIDLLIKKLSSPDDKSFIKVCRKYLKDISIGSFCDNFIQNIYLSDLDSLLQPYSWKYIRLTDDIRVFCNSKEEADLALQIIVCQLEKLHLKVNPSKCFTIKPKTTIEEFRTNKRKYQQDETSNILQLSKITEYPVENVFTLSSNSQCDYFLKYRYNTDFPRELTYQDEVLQKMGYKIKGRDIKDILSEIESSENLNGEEYKILIEILTNAFHTFRVYLNIIKLYLSSLLKEKDTNVASDNFAFLVSYLTTNCSKNSQLYLSYCFIKIVFIEQSYFNKVNSYRALINQNIKTCWNLFYQIIYQNSDENYLCKEIGYLFNNEIFKLSHKEKGNLIKRDDFWSSLIEKEICDAKFGPYSAHTDNIIKFLNGQFVNSSILNLSRAKFYFKRNKYKEALEFFLWIKANNPDSNIDFELGNCCYYEKKYCESILHYSDYLTLNKSSEAAFNNRALSYQKLKKYDEAIADFTKAIELTNNKIIYFRNRAYCLVEMDLHQEGLRDLNTAIQLNEQSHRPNIYWLDNSNNNYSSEQHDIDVWLYYKRAEVKIVINDIDGAKADLQNYCATKYFFEYRDGDSEYLKRTFNRLLKEMMDEK